MFYFITQFLKMRFMIFELYMHYELNYKHNYNLIEIIKNELIQEYKNGLYYTYKYNSIFWFKNNKYNGLHDVSSKTISRTENCYEDNKFEIVYYDWNSLKPHHHIVPKDCKIMVMIIQYIILIVIILKKLYLNSNKPIHL